jgi:hypothetical protein
VKRLTQHLPSGAAFLLLAALAPAAWAQAFCASDGQRLASGLTERFINADCADCWSDKAAPKAPKNYLTLDWVLPGGQGADAPLAPVASSDAERRISALRLATPLLTVVSSRAVQPSAALAKNRLRVAHGTTLSDYIGVSIEVKPPPPAAAKQTTAYLALVETLPVGTEGSAVERHLVRNLLEVAVRNSPSQAAAKRFFESRVMSVAPSAKQERLSVVGWLEDDQGRVLKAVQSRCVLSKG